METDGLREQHGNPRRADQTLSPIWKGLSGIQLPIPDFLFNLGRKGIILIR